MNNMGLGFVFTAPDLASAKMMSLERHFSELALVSAGGPLCWRRGGQRAQRCTF
jgi:hypothetical protein